MKDLQIRRYYRERFCDRKPAIVTEFFIANSYPRPLKYIGTVNDEYSELMFKQVMMNETCIGTISFKDETDDYYIPLYLQDYTQEDFCTQHFRIIHPAKPFPTKTKEEMIHEYLDKEDFIGDNFSCFSIFYHPEIDDSETVFCCDEDNAISELIRNLRNYQSKNSRIRDIKVSRYRENILIFTLCYKAGFWEEYYVNINSAKKGGYSNG